MLDFFDLSSEAAEREFEQTLTGRIIDTLRELGPGFAFVGRQVHFDVGGDDFYVDLPIFHVEQLRYVVIELKTGELEPEHIGQLQFYVALVDDRLRRAAHAPTVGILCAEAGTNTLSATPWTRPTHPWRSPPAPIRGCPPRNVQPCPVKTTSPRPWPGPRPAIPTTNPGRRPALM